MNDYLKTGYLSSEELKGFIPDEKIIRKKTVALTECIQEIPCNPCVTSCPVGAISMKDINDIPRVDFEKCTGCGKCVSICPGLAIFLIGITDNQGEVTLPYEMLPLPQRGSIVNLLNRKGEVIGEGTVKRILLPEKETSSAIITVVFKNPSLVYDVRNIKVKNG